MTLGLKVRGDMSLLRITENEALHPSEIRRDGSEGHAGWVVPATIQQSHIGTCLQGSNKAGQTALGSSK